MLPEFSLPTVTSGIKVSFLCNRLLFQAVGSDQKQLKAYAFAYRKPSF
jgi:hypothetical protein